MQCWQVQRCEDRNPLVRQSAITVLRSAARDGGRNGVMQCVRAGALPSLLKMLSDEGFRARGAAADAIRAVRRLCPRADLDEALEATARDSRNSATTRATAFYIACENWEGGPTCSELWIPKLLGPVPVPYQPAPGQPTVIEGNGFPDPRMLAAAGDATGDRAPAVRLAAARALCAAVRVSSSFPEEDAEGLQSVLQARRDDGSSVLEGVILLSRDVLWPDTRAAAMRFLALVMCAPPGAAAVETLTGLASGALQREIHRVLEQHVEEERQPQLPKPLDDRKAPEVGQSQASASDDPKAAAAAAAAAAIAHEQATVTASAAALAEVDRGAGVLPPQLMARISTVLAVRPADATKPAALLPGSDGDSDEEGAAAMLTTRGQQLVAVANAVVGGLTPLQAAAVVASPLPGLLDPDRPAPAYAAAVAARTSQAAPSEQARLAAATPAAAAASRVSFAASASRASIRDSSAAPSRTPSGALGPVISRAPSSWGASALLDGAAAPRRPPQAAAAVDPRLEPTQGRLVPRPWAAWGVLARVPGQPATAQDAASPQQRRKRRKRKPGPKGPDEGPLVVTPGWLSFQPGARADSVLPFDNWNLDG